MSDFKALVLSICVLATSFAIVAVPIVLAAVVASSPLGKVVASSHLGEVLMDLVLVDYTAPTVCPGGTIADFGEVCE